MSYVSEGFKMDLRKTFTLKKDIWSFSGYSVCAPEMGTVCGVNGFFSPPFSAPDTGFGIAFTVNGHSVPDTGNRGKNDCGLLYSGGDWYPEKIVRYGTYHWVADDKLLSFSVTSEMTPLFKTAGFAVKVIVKNHAKDELNIELLPIISAGHPSIVPLDNWEFTPPKPSSDEAKMISEGIFENNEIRISVINKSNSKIIKSGEKGEFIFGVIFSEAGEAVECDMSEKISEAHTRWAGLISLAGQKMPSIKSDIPGLQAYFERSLLSGLVCIWENDDFITNPFPSTSGVDGGSICCYPWDVAGYGAQTLVMLLGEKSLDFFKAMLDSGIDKHISMSPAGSGLGWCPYSYSMWSLVNMYVTILAYCDKGQELFNQIVEIFEVEEKRLPEWEHLKDYGRQHNLLETRTCGYEYFVVSPNAERAWCYDRLSDIGEKMGRDCKKWREKAGKIRQAIKEKLWDEKSEWFKCIHPDNHIEMVYSIQMFDALRNGACDEGMKKGLLRHVCDGRFLGEYGISTISAEDTLHYELNDPDWSGGGGYSGEGPNLAETLWNADEPELAYDVLRRHFWMGEKLLYYPQEHYCDKPAIPEMNKRANIIAGVSGLQAILFGMAGIKADFDGKITINPHPPKSGYVEIHNYKFRSYVIDILLKPDFAKITVDGRVIHEGAPKKVII